MRPKLQHEGHWNRSFYEGLHLLLQVRRNKRKQPKVPGGYPRSDQPQPANGRGGAATAGKMSGGRSGGPGAGKNVLERGDDFERLPVPKAARKKVCAAARNR